MPTDLCGFRQHPLNVFRGPQRIDVVQTNRHRRRRALCFLPPLSESSSNPLAATDGAPEASQILRGWSSSDRLRGASLGRFPGPVRVGDACELEGQAEAETAGHSGSAAQSFVAR